MELATIIAVIVTALVFDYTNGFHDAANAIATSVSTRALTPRVALLMAAVMNFVGAFLGTKVAKTVFSVLEPPSGEHALVVVLAALVGAITWNLTTWYFGLPSSSSHALIGGLVGAGLAGGVTVQWASVVDKVVIPMFLSPVVGVRARLPADGRRSSGPSARPSPGRPSAASGWRRPSRRRRWPSATACRTRRRRWASSSWPWSSAATRTASRSPGGSSCSSAAAISLGTYSGGWRIMRTLGRRIIEIDPARGFAAETVAASVLYTTAYVFEAPISTTQAITGSIMGAGATKGRKAVRWGVAGNILVAWVLTIPMAGLVAAVVYWVVHLILE